MKVSDVFACSFPSWYEKFKKSTIKSIVLPMPPEVLAYMQDNGTLVLPEGSQPEPSYKVNDEDNGDWDVCDDTSEGAAQAPKLEEFNERIKEAVKKLGGSVFPKLNWSAPKDATWIALNNSMLCSTPGDIYLLLKSSTFTAYDLTSPFKHCVDKLEADTSVKYCVVLRKWMEINPAHEFRCFIKDKELIGISQRDVTQSYACIGADQANIRSDIISFWHEIIENRFPLDNYTFDVYRPAKDKITLIDFNPFGVSTDSLLFSWYEFKVLERRPTTPIIEDDPDVESLCEDIQDCTVDGMYIMDSNRRCNSLTSLEDKPEFRFILSNTGVQPSPYLQYGLPVDLVDLSTGEDPQKLIDFLQMKTQNELQMTDSSDDELS